MEKKRFRSIWLILSICFCIFATTVVPVQAASKNYKKYKGEWYWEGDPTRIVKVISCSSKKIKLKISVSGSISIPQNGYRLVTGNWQDSTRTITKKLKKGKTSFTIYTKKKKKIKVKLKLSKYKKREGFATGLVTEIRSSNKIWNQGRGYAGYFKY